MSPHRRNGVFQLYVPRQDGEALERSTGTKDLKVFRGMKRLVEQLHESRRWALLTPLVTPKVPGSRVPRLTLGRLYDAHTANRLDALELELSALALAPHVVAYLKDCKARGLAHRNVENITRQLKSFLAVATTTADLSTATVQGWLGGLTTTPGTRRQYLYAVTGFVKYLCDMEVLKSYPLTRIRTPKKNRARDRYESAENDERIVTAARLELQGLFAFVKGTGVDLSVALSTPVRSIDLARARARLDGTKTAQRVVHEALIEAWAIPYIRKAVAGCMPNVRPWEKISRSVTAKQHTICCKAVGVEDYTLKDARHSVGVRMAKAGYTIHEIAEQLGNSPEICAKVYTRFIPKMEHKATLDATSSQPRLTDVG